jgi:DNA-binding transcriptional regulator LsrR (DeoR family)
MTDPLSDAVRVARMYYYQERTTQEIAGELGLSRSKVSRLLKLAKAQGLVEIRVIDPNTQASALEGSIQTRFGVPEVHVVDVPETAGEQEWLERVATVAAAYLSTLMKDGTILATAWGTTVSAISERLGVKPLKNVQVVQLNGSGNTHDAGLLYSAEILRHFSEAYGAKTHTFPVPTFFRLPGNQGGALARAQRSAHPGFAGAGRHPPLQHRRVRGGACRATSIPGATSSPPTSPNSSARVSSATSPRCFSEPTARTGTFPSTPARAVPDLSMFTQAENAVCVVSGRGKVAGLRAALAGGYLKKLIIDEPTARMLCADLEASPQTSGAKPRT